MLITILPQVLLIVGLGALIVFLVTTCIKFTKGPISTDALKRQLRLLQLKFVTAETINPDVERREMEILQNKIKTSNDALIISDDNDLKLLSGSNCKYIQLEMDNVNLANRSSWVQFRELMLGFDRFYFQS